MSHLDARKSVHSCGGLSRRDFLHAGSLACLGLGLPAANALETRGNSAADDDVSCILLFLVGGPSQLDTWDPKPAAPEEIRGPFRAIDTRVPGMQVTEIFPRLAGMMDRVSVVRTVNHSAAAVHDTGHQMMQTGRLFTGGIDHPHYGSVLAKLRGARRDAPPYVLLPKPIGATGGNMPHGQNAGYLGTTFDPFVLKTDPSQSAFELPEIPPPDFIAAVREESRGALPASIDGAGGTSKASPDARLLGTNFEGAYKRMASRTAREAFDLTAEPDFVRDRYGRTRFGQSCLLARRLVERGVRFVTVNMFETVFNEITWDIHGSAPFSPIDCYKNEVGPNFDNAYTALLGDLSQRGLLGKTMVLAFGEFGRTPKINPAGGRDHHPACWSVLFAGGPIQGGRIVGASDDTGHAPKDRPVSTAEIAATVYRGLGISLDSELPGPQGLSIRLVDHGVEPINELF